jgi:hypothetical protein
VLNVPAPTPMTLRCRRRSRFGQADQHPGEQEEAGHAAVTAVLLGPFETWAVGQTPGHPVCDWVVRLVPRVAHPEMPGQRQARS